MSKGQTLQDPFLNALRKDRIPVSIFLVNGIKLQGQIESFDQYVVLLKNTVSQMVYKHAISTIVPARNPRTAGDAPTPAYPAGNGVGFEQRGGYQGGRGGFTRSAGTGFERGGFEQRGGYQGQGAFERGGFEQRGFGGGFDRASYEERGFDGKTFDADKGFDAQNFDKKVFGNDGYDDDNYSN